MAQLPILHLEQVTRQFSKRDAPAVSGVTLTLNQGDILGLLGPSGCGKTTLLRLIAGFEQPQLGWIKLAEQTVADPKNCVAPELRSVGMVFQDFALFPHLSVAENIAFGLKSLGRKPNASDISERRGKPFIKQRVAEAIALVGLQGKENRYPHELSGGQQQRVALARALAPQPSLILLDEPLSNLDVQVRLYLRQEVREILKATGTSAIFVTHDQEEALAISDQVGVMRQGQLEQLGTPEQIYCEPASRFVAEFVTQANFLPAQRQGQVWHTEAGCFHIDGTTHVCSCAPQTLQPYSGELMIRQEDLRIEPDETGVVVVRDRQFLGREYGYCLQTPSGQKLHARTVAAKLIPVGARVRLSVTHQALRFFPHPHSQAPVQNIS